MPKITLKNILQFIQGNANMLGDAFNLLPPHKKEQVLYRMDLCKNDCIPNGKCKYCGCSVPGKLYVDRSCNGGEIFPDMMDAEKWTQFKIDNDIGIN